MSLTAEVEIGLVTDGVIWECPEDPVRFAGQPLGQYHCPWCGCMQIAGLSHMDWDVNCWLGLWIWTEVPDEP